MTHLTLSTKSRTSLILQIIGITCVLICISWASISSMLQAVNTTQDFQPASPISVQDLQASLNRDPAQIPMRSTL